MSKNVVRILRIKVNHLKNVCSGEIILKNYAGVKKNNSLLNGDIAGIYGQNGSGKTAVVEALHILKMVLSGIKVEAEIADLISVDKGACMLGFTFLILTEGQKYLVDYDFELRREDNANRIMISKEVISCSQSVEGKWKSKVKLIDYNYDEEDIFRPAARYHKIIGRDKKRFLDLSVAKEVSRKLATSFIFSKDVQDIFKQCQTADSIIEIVSSLQNFALYNLYVITNDKMGIISLNQLLPFTFRLEDDKSVISGNVVVRLFEMSVVPEETFDLLLGVIKQINKVLGAIIPKMQLEVFVHGKSYTMEGKSGLQIELLSVNNEKKISLVNESDGIKKIISVLSTIIAMYNNPGVCLVIDELDSGVYEYLLGEILEVLERGCFGQLIFTSHNLRALEKLNKESIIFTTTNPENRYIRLEYVKSNNNLRDMYLRVISLGGQKETVYQETNTYEIQYALRNAGRVTDAD